MQRKRTVGMELAPGLAVSRAVLQGSAAQKLLGTTLQTRAAAGGTASTLTAPAGRGCKGLWLPGRAT